MKKYKIGDTVLIRAKVEEAEPKSISRSCKRSKTTSFSRTSW